MLTKRKCARVSQKDKFGVALWKKANNAVFGKSMENVHNRRNIVIVTNQHDFEKLAKKKTFNDFEHLEDLNPNVKEGVTIVELEKSKVHLNKAISNGQAILDCSKIIPYKFHYDYIKKKYPGDKSQLCAIDTDGLVYNIKTEDFYRDIKDDPSFDTSNFPKEHFLYSEKN